MSIFKGTYDINYYQKIVEATLEHLQRLVLRTGVEIKLFDTHMENSEQKQSAACLKYPVLRDGCEGSKATDYVFAIHVFIPGTHPGDKYKDDLIMRYKPIIDAVGATIDDTSIFLCTLLHELGHCDYIKQFFNLKLNLSDYNEVCMTNENKIYEIFGGKAHMISEYGMTYIYLFSDELFCDYFVYRNFPRIWSNLKSLGLVVLPQA